MFYHLPHTSGCLQCLPHIKVIESYYFNDVSCRPTKKDCICSYFAWPSFGMATAMELIYQGYLQISTHIACAPTFWHFNTFCTLIPLKVVYFAPYSSRVPQKLRKTLWNCSLPFAQFKFSRRCRTKTRHCKDSDTPSPLLNK